MRKALLSLLILSLVIVIDSNQQRGFYKSSCERFKNPCNSTRNLACNHASKRCLCARHPSPLYVFLIDVTAGACVPVRNTESDREAFWRCEDQLKNATTQSSTESTGLGACKCNHDCHAKNSVCNLSKCACECSANATLYQNQCVHPAKFYGACTSDEECHVGLGEDSECGQPDLTCRCKLGFAFDTDKNVCKTYVDVNANAKPNDPITWSENTIDVPELSTEPPARVRAWNSTPATKREKEPSSNFEGPPLLGHYTFWSLALLLALSLSLILTCGVWCRARTQGRKRKKKDAKGPPLLPVIHGQEPMARLTRPSTAAAAPTGGPPEVTTLGFTIDHAIVLGDGKGGSVYAGNYSGTQIAVKTLKPDCRQPDIYLDSLYEEIDILKSLAEHANIVKLLAYSYGDGRGMSTTRECYLLMELCPLGSLQKYLRTNRHIRVPAGSQTYYVEFEAGAENLDHYTDHDLLHFSLQIAIGMEYLAGQGVVHCDLAARNVVLKTRHQIKIIDFGFARRLAGESPTYVKTHDPVPWRSSPPEVLTDNLFSTQSDVWSFGVTLWEIFSKGIEPYTGVTFTRTTFPEELYNGRHRLEQPELAPTPIYRLMKKCWQSEPSRRIGFTELKRELYNFTHRPLGQEADTHSDYTQIGDDGYLTSINGSRISSN